MRRRVCGSVCAIARSTEQSFAVSGHLVPLSRISAVWKWDFLIEVDGGQHSERELADARRTQFLEEQGFLVLRFWNNEVLEQTEAVVEWIRMAIEQCRKERRRYGIKSPSP